MPVLIILVLLVFLGSLNRIVKAGVETVGPKVTGTTVTLRQVKISPFSAQGTLGGLLVGNPAGFKTDSAVRPRLDHGYQRPQAEGQLGPMPVLPRER